MIDLDQQIQVLINNAPQDGATPQIVAAIAPALKSLAQQLKHLQYYIWQTPDQKWVLTTLSNRTKPQLEKRVVYAFVTPQDALDSGIGGEPKVQAQPLAVTHILFQMLAIKPLDSIVFFETVGNWEFGTEVLRSDVDKMVQVYLEQYQRDRSNFA